jgi:capsular exopolysaccharide synthesis family protein
MENQQLQEPQEETINIKKYLFLILSNWYWFAITIVIGLVLAYFANRYTPSQYSVSSTLLVRDDDNSKSFSGAENFMQGLKLLQQTKSVQNEIGILQTYTLARRAIDKLPEFKVTYVKIGRSRLREDNLYTASPFVVNLDTSAMLPFGAPIHITFTSPNSFKLETEIGGKIKGSYKLNDTITIGESKFSIGLRINALANDDYVGVHYFFTVNNPHALANMYRAKTGVTLNDKKGSILSLTTQGPVPQQETDYLNKLMEEYINFGLENKNKIAENTMQFIDEQIFGVSDSLRAAESSLQNFRSKNMIIDIDKEGAISYNQLESYKTEKSMALIRGKYLDYLLKYVNDKKDVKDIVSPAVVGLNDQSLSKSINDLADLYMQKQVLSYNAQETNPGMEVLNLKIENGRKIFLETIRSLIQTNNLSIKDVDERIAKAEGDVSKIPASERQLINIEREFNVLDKMYTYLLEKRAEAGIAKASNISDSRVLDYAMPENAAVVSPKTKMNYMLGFALGFILPLAVLLIIDFMNDSIQDKKEIESKTQVPIYGGVGHNFKGTDLPVYENPKSSLAESFRALRTNLQFTESDKDNKIIVVTSTISSEGKTFVASNLATIFSLASKKTLLIALDLRKPKMNKVFNVNGKEGLSTYLSGQSKYENVIYPSAIDNLFIAPSGPIPPNPAELIESHHMKEFLEKAASEFDIIIIDTPPVAVVTDALLLSNMSDLFLYVVRQNLSSREVISLINSLHQRKEIRKLGIVINDIQIKGYYGGYYNKYTYNYGYYNSYGEGYYSDEEMPKVSILKKIKTRMGLKG